MRRKILINSIRCNFCGAVITSESVHDFKFCPCGKVAVDGDHDYLKRCGNFGDWEDLSKVEFVEENDDN